MSSTDDDGVCAECGGCYKDDDRATRKCWMGCDSCERWFHCTCQCVSLREVPEGQSGLVIIANFSTPDTPFSPQARVTYLEPNILLYMSCHTFF